MAKSVAVNGTDDRATQIRAAADQMRSILAGAVERADYIDRQIADLQAEREEILQRLESTIGAVALPQIDKPAAPAVDRIATVRMQPKATAPSADVPEPSKRELVFQTLLQHGAMTALQLQELVGNVAVVSAHLTHLKSQKRVLHVGNMWSAKQ